MGGVVDIYSKTPHYEIFFNNTFPIYYTTKTFCFIDIISFHFWYLPDINFHEKR